jgi:prepilin-type N-terminal cleavage/methylation domain-containing protein
MKKTTSRNGFTLIELIIVMVILGIMAAVAVPRYLDSIENAEESAEEAVISAIRGGLKQFANNSLLDNGRSSWPTNPFSALSEDADGEVDLVGYTTDGDMADTDGEWTFIDNGNGTGKITHQRADNSRYTWDYNSGVQENDADNDSGDNTAIGTLGPRTAV